MSHLKKYTKCRDTKCKHLFTKKEYDDAKKEFAEQVKKICEGDKGKGKGKSNDNMNRIKKEIRCSMKLMKKSKYNKMMKKKKENVHKYIVKKNTKNFLKVYQTQSKYFKPK